MWKNMCDRAKLIFNTAVLPELVGKSFTRLPKISTVSGKEVMSDMQNIEPLPCGSQSGKEKTWCSCDQVEFGKMIFCDNDDCLIQWFHYGCVGVSCAPRGKWFCPECWKLPQFKSKYTKLK